MTNIDSMTLTTLWEIEEEEHAGRIFAGYRNLFDYEECNGSLLRYT